MTSRCLQAPQEGRGPGRDQSLEPRVSPPICGEREQTPPPTWPSLLTLPRCWLPPSLRLRPDEAGRDSCRPNSWDASGKDDQCCVPGTSAAIPVCSIRRPPWRPCCRRALHAGQGPLTAPPRGFPLLFRTDLHPSSELGNVRNSVRPEVHV